MLPDLLAPRLRLVVVGTAAGLCSAARGHYYACRGNSFWQLLHDSGIVDRPLGPADDAQLPALGIGLTDLAKGVAQSHDRGLRYDVPGLVGKLEVVRPGWVAFHGKTAAGAVARALGQPKPGLGPVDWRVAGAEVFVLPSASGANRRRDYDGLPTRLEWWRQLAALLG